MTMKTSRWTGKTHLPKNCQLLHQQMSALCFACSTFPADHNALRTGWHRQHSEVENNKMTRSGLQISCHQTVQVKNNFLDVSGVTS